MIIKIRKIQGDTIRLSEITVDDVNDAIRSSIAELEQPITRKNSNLYGISGRATLTLVRNDDDLRDAFELGVIRLAVDVTAANYNPYPKGARSREAQIAGDASAAEREKMTRVFELTKQEFTQRGWKEDLALATYWAQQIKNEKLVDETLESNRVTFILQWPHGKGPKPVVAAQAPPSFPMPPYPYPPQAYPPYAYPPQHYPISPPGANFPPPPPLPPPPIAVAPSPGIAGAGGGDEFSRFLAVAGLSDFETALRTTHGLNEVDDLRFATEEELKGVGFTPFQVARLKRHLEKNELLKEQGK